VLLGVKKSTRFRDGEPANPPSSPGKGLAATPPLPLAELQEDGVPNPATIGFEASPHSEEKVAIQQSTLREPSPSFLFVHEFNCETPFKYPVPTFQKLATYASWPEGPPVDPKKTS